MNTTLVIGGGFRGILTALLRARRGESVTLIESARALGGVLQSIPWNGFQLDLGCHLFDNSADEETDLILEILGDRHHPVSVSYASRFLGVTHSGLAVPCLASVDTTTARTMLHEVMTGVGRQHTKPASLHERIEQRHGATAAALLAPAIAKVYRHDPRELAPECLELGTFTRIAQFDEPLTRTLKRLPELDAALARRSDHDPMLFHRDRSRRSWRHFYPTGGGMGVFCERAAKLLELEGVRVVLGHEVRAVQREPGRVRVHGATRGADENVTFEARRAVWCSGIEKLAGLLGNGAELESRVLGVPMVVYSFAIPAASAGRWSYTQDFDADTPAFRMSVPGNYGRGNCPDGMSYVCCEVPTDVGSPIWNDPAASAESVFQQARDAGLTDANAPTAMHVLRTPSSYRLLRRGYADAAQRFLHSLDGAEEWLIDARQETAKSRILAAVRAELAA